MILATQKINLIDWKIWPRHEKPEKTSRCTWPSQPPKYFDSLICDVMTRRTLSEFSQKLIKHAHTKLFCTLSTHSSAFLYINDLKFYWAQLYWIKLQHYTGFIWKRGQTRNTKGENLKGSYPQSQLQNTYKNERRYSRKPHINWNIINVHAQWNCSKDLRSVVMHASHLRNRDS